MSRQAIGSMKRQVITMTPTPGCTGIQHLKHGEYSSSFLCAKRRCVQLTLFCRYQRDAQGQYTRAGDAGSQSVNGTDSSTTKTGAETNAKAKAVADGIKAAKATEKWLKANKKKNAGLEAVTIAADRYVRLSPCTSDSDFHTTCILFGLCPSI